jgi:hypothetical protein
LLVHCSTSVTPAHDLTVQHRPGLGKRDGGRDTL